MVEEFNKSKHIFSSQEIQGIFVRGSEVRNSRISTELHFGLISRCHKSGLECEHIYKNQLICKYFEVFIQMDFTCLFADFSSISCPYLGNRKLIFVLIFYSQSPVIVKGTNINTSILQLRKLILRKSNLFAQVSQFFYSTTFWSH